MKITISSAFNCSASAYAFDGQNFNRLAAVPDCTWVGDTAYEETVDINLGAVVYNNRQHGTSLKLVGDWEAELLLCLDNLLVFTWGQHTQGWHIVRDTRDWVLGVITESLMTVQELVDTCGCQLLSDGSAAVELPRCEDFLVISPEGEVEVWQGPWGSPLFISPEGELTCSEWENQKHQNKFSHLYNKWENKVRRLLTRPSAVKKVISSLPQEAREVIEVIAAEMWPITCGGRSPQRAP